MKLRKTYSLVYLVLTEGVHVYNIFLKNNWSSVGIIYRLKYRSPKADLLSNMTVKRNNSFWHFLQEAYMNVPCMLLHKSLHSFFTGSIHECSLYVAMQKFTIFVFIQTMQWSSFVYRVLNAIVSYKVYSCTGQLFECICQECQCLEHCIAVRYVNGLGMISYLENSCLSVNFVFPSYSCICFRLDYILILKRKFKQ